MSKVAELGYWNTRGIAQPIRLLLKQVGVPFVDKRYEFGDGNTAEEIQVNWIPVKYTLGLDFPNLPYFIDNDIQLTQSLAIMRYLARKYGLIAKEEPNISHQEMVEQQLNDVKMSFVANEKNKEAFVSTILPQHLTLLSKYLGEKDWFVGELTYVDFMAYEVFDMLRAFSPGSIENYTNLARFLNRLEKLPNIAAYLKSDEFKAWPFRGPRASWGYRK